MLKNTTNTILLYAVTASLLILGTGCESGNEGVATLNAADARASEAEAVQNADRLESELEQIRSELENSLKVNRDLNHALLEATEQVSGSESTIESMVDIVDSIQSDFMSLSEQMDAFENRIMEMKNMLDEHRSEEDGPSSQTDTDEGGETATDAEAESDNVESAG